MDQAEIKKRILAAYDLLENPSVSIDRFESVKQLLHGVNPKIDSILESCSNAFSALSKLNEGEIIELSVENLPENSEKEKKRKKALLLFLKYWKQLKSEVERIKNELSKNETNKTKTVKIASHAKGFLGVITVVALIIVIGTLLLQKNKTVVKSLPSITPAVSNKIKVIDFQNKRIPLTQLRIGIGPECLTNGKQAQHYHALNHETVKTTDGTAIVDPGGCGYGKVELTPITEL